MWTGFMKQNKTSMLLRSTTTIDLHTMARIPPSVAPIDFKYSSFRLSVLDCDSKWTSFTAFFLTSLFLDLDYQKICIGSNCSLYRTSQLTILFRSCHSENLVAHLFRVLLLLRGVPLKIKNLQFC